MYNNMNVIVTSYATTCLLVLNHKWNRSRLDVRTVPHNITSTVISVLQSIIVSLIDLVRMMYSIQFILSLNILCQSNRRINRSLLLHQLRQLV